MNYKKNYLKYKLKYLILKKIYTGGSNLEKTFQDDHKLTKEEKELGLYSSPPFESSYTELLIYDCSGTKRTLYIKSENLDILQDKYTMQLIKKRKCNASNKDIEVYQLQEMPPSPSLSCEKPPRT